MNSILPCSHRARSFVTILKAPDLNCYLMDLLFAVCQDGGYCLGAASSFEEMTQAPCSAAGFLGDKGAITYVPNREDI